MNLYSNKGNMADLTDTQAERITEIELWLVWKKIKGMVHYKNQPKAMEFLLVLLNPYGEEDLLKLEKLKNILLESELLAPSIDEIIIYQRFRGLGLNKITRLTGKQNVQLHNLLDDVDFSFLIPRMRFNWSWTENATLIEAIRVVAHDLLFTHEEHFYKSINLKSAKSNQNIDNMDSYRL